MIAARIAITPSAHVTAIAYPATGARVDVTFVLAHGAGVNQSSRFLVQFAEALAARGIDVLTFNFLYGEQRKRVPDRNDRLEACYRNVIDAVGGGTFADSLGRRAGDRRRIDGRPHRLAGGCHGQHRD